MPQLYSKSVALYIVMPCTGLQECTNVFSTGGGESLAQLCSVPFLGRSSHAEVTMLFTCFFLTQEECHWTQD